MKILGTCVLFVLIGMLVLSSVAVAKDPVAAARAQLTTARTHAGELAQRATTIAATQLHLRHVINCLEGPNGKDFTAAVGNPCQGQGNGILVDLQAAVSAGSSGAEQAMKFANAGLQVALQGVASTDINQAQPYALVVARQLESALAALAR